jgi:rubredoxin
MHHDKLRRAMRALDVESAPAFYAERREPRGCLRLQPTCDSIMKTWMCLICGWIYDEAAGAPEEGLAPGTLWADVPMNWTCPECGARKEDFEMIEV